MIFLIRWWNRLRNRPLITELQREIICLNQIIDHWPDPDSQSGGPDYGPHR